MTDARQQRSGAIPRRERISDAETERRVLDAARELIAERGMSVSLGHLSFEEVIRAAAVSRTSAYRRWPYKDDFVSDLLVDLARGNDLGEVNPRLAADASALVAGRADDLSTEDGRRDLVVDLLRIAFQRDFEALYSSAQFRTYIALRATFLGLPDGDLRRDVGAALAETERRFTANRAALFAAMAAMLGYQPAPPLDGSDGFELISRALGSAMAGLVVTALASPELVTERRQLRAFGSTRPAEWSTPAFVLTGIILSHVELDPDHRWDRSTTQQLTAELSSRLSAAVNH